MWLLPKSLPLFKELAHSFNVKSYLKWKSRKHHQPLFAFPYSCSPLVGFMGVSLNGSMIPLVLEEVTIPGWVSHPDTYMRPQQHLILSLPMQAFALSYYKSSSKNENDLLAIAAILQRRLETLGRSVLLVWLKEAFTNNFLLSSMHGWSVNHCHFTIDSTIVTALVQPQTTVSPLSGKNLNQIFPKSSQFSRAVMGWSS